jgi:hypothetical protein
VVGPDGHVLGAGACLDGPAGNVQLSSATEALRQVLIGHRRHVLHQQARNESARAAIFTRKVGHTQRVGILFDRFHAARRHAVDLPSEEINLPFSVG